MHTQSAIIPLAVVFTALLSGCATILKNPRERLPIVGPADVLVATIDSGAVPVYLDKRNQRYIELPATKDYQFTVTGGGRRDTVLLETSPSAGYVAVDAVALFVGLVVDGATGAWNSFNNQGLAFLNDSVASALGRSPGWNMLPNSAMRALDSSDPIGLTASLFATHVTIPSSSGASLPPFLVSGFGAALAYRAAPEFEAGIIADVGAGGAFVGRRSEGEGVLTRTIHAYALHGKHSGWTIRSGLGVTFCREAPYEGWAPSLSLAGGYRVGLFFVEARALIGLSGVEMEHTVKIHDRFYTWGPPRQSLFMLTLHSGLHIEI